MKLYLFIPLVLLLSFSACIKDDIVLDTIEPTFSINVSADTLGIDDEFLFEARYTNNVGVTEDVTVDWSSSNPDIISITADGLAKAISSGESTIFASYENDGQTFSAEKIVAVGEETVVTVPEDKSGTIMPSSFYDLTGDFTITKEGEDLIIAFADNYVADDGLPGLYVYLTNNPSSIAGALEVRKVDIFSGAHEYRVSGNLSLDAYSHLLYFCKPFNVKVGDGAIN